MKKPDPVALGIVLGLLAFVVFGWFFLVKPSQEFYATLMPTPHPSATPWPTTDDKRFAAYFRDFGPDEYALIPPGTDEVSGFNPCAVEPKARIVYVCDKRGCQRVVVHCREGAR